MLNRPPWSATMDLTIARTPRAAHPPGPDKSPRRPGIRGGTVSSVNQELYQRSISVNLPLDLGSALFGKLVAKQLQAAADFDTEAQKNDVLFAAASAYFDLVNAVAAQDIASEALRISQDYEQQLDRGYRAGHHQPHRAITRQRADAAAPAIAQHAIAG